LTAGSCPLYPPQRGDMAYNSTTPDIRQSQVKAGAKTEKIQIHPKCPGVDRKDA